MFTLPEVPICKIFLVCSLREVHCFVWEVSWTATRLLFSWQYQLYCEQSCSFIGTCFLHNGKDTAYLLFLWRFLETGCWWYRWMTQYSSSSYSLINSVSWHCCWGKQSHPAHATIVHFHFAVTSVSSWILPCTCRNRKDEEVGKRYYLWGR